MKYVMQLFLLVCYLHTNAQQPVPRIENDSLFTGSGMVIGKGQKIKLGLGTMPDGNFKFVRINTSSIFHNTEITNYNSGFNANSANSMNRRESGREFSVKRLEKRGDENHGYRYYLVLAGMPRYEVDIENAIASGEVEVPAKFRVASAAGLSIAEELTRFKKLLDEGALTAEEFAIQKKKLLGKS